VAKLANSSAPLGSDLQFVASTQQAVAYLTVHVHKPNCLTATANSGECPNGSNSKRAYKIEFVKAFFNETPKRLQVKAYDINAAGSKPVIAKLAFGNSSYAVPPTCTLVASPRAVTAGGQVTLTTIMQGKPTEAKLSPG